jgi:hypothetical protein
MKCISLGVLAAALLLTSMCTGAHAQDSMKDQLLGTWTLVAVTSEAPDGTKAEPFGPNPKGFRRMDISRSCNRAPKFPGSRPTIA